MRSARPLPSPRRLLFRTKLLLKRGPGRSSLDVSSCCRCPTQVPQDRRLGVVVREARQIVFLSVVATAMSKAASNEALPVRVSKRIQVWHNQPSWREPLSLWSFFGRLVHSERGSLTSLFPVEDNPIPGYPRRNPKGRDQSVPTCRAKASSSRGRVGLFAVSVLYAPYSHPRSLR